MTVKIQLKTLKKNVTELRTNTSQILTDMCVPKKNLAWVSLYKSGILIFYYRLPITDYRLTITDYRLPITAYRLPLTT